MRKCATCNWPYALFVHGQALYFVSSVNMTKVHPLFFMKGPDHIRVVGTICHASGNCMTAKSTCFSGIRRCTYWWESFTLKSNRPLSYEACPRLHNFFCTHFQVCLPPSYLEIWVLAHFSSEKCCSKTKNSICELCCCHGSKMAINKYKTTLHNIPEEWRAQIQDLSVLCEEFPFHIYYSFVRDVSAILKLPVVYKSTWTTF